LPATETGPGLQRPPLSSHHLAEDEQQRAAILARRRSKNVERDTVKCRSTGKTERRLDQEQGEPSRKQSPHPITSRR
jgi:hypothetical protein